jgi:hypothetical protein
MEKLIIEPGRRTPGIKFSPGENIFYIRGTSSPEDARKMYCPVVEWINKFIEEILNSGVKTYNNENPIRFQIDLNYFNSSSAKFLFDILVGLKKLQPAGIPVIIEWYYEKGDNDEKEGGIDFSHLVEMEFTLIPKSS